VGKNYATSPLSMGKSTISMAINGLIDIYILIWLVVEPPTPLKNDGVKVSWDDDIPN